MAAKCYTLYGYELNFRLVPGIYLYKEDGRRYIKLGNSGYKSRLVRVYVPDNAVIVDDTLMEIDLPFAAVINVSDQVPEEVDVWKFVEFVDSLCPNDGIEDSEPCEYCGELGPRHTIPTRDLDLDEVGIKILATGYWDKIPEHLIGFPPCRFSIKRIINSGREDIPEISSFVVTEQEILYIKDAISEVYSKLCSQGLQDLMIPRLF